MLMFLTVGGLFGTWPLRPSLFQSWETRKTQLRRRTDAWPVTLIIEKTGDGCSDLVGMLAVDGVRCAGNDHDLAVCQCAPRRLGSNLRIVHDGFSRDDRQDRQFK